jgi:uncharacterized membrane protein
VMGHALRIVEIIDNVHHRAEQVIDTMYPEELVVDCYETEITTVAPASATIHNHGRSGVVASLDVGRLVAEAVRVDTTFELACSIGSYVPVGGPLLYVADRRPDLDEERLRGAVTVADERTIDQDPLYALRLLVDIATRALSPAVNDPTTAVQVLDRIEAILRLLATRRLDRGTIADGEGRVRLIVPLPGWEDFVSVGLTEIRLYGATSMQVVRRLRAVLNDLLLDASESRRAVLERQLALLDQTVESCYPDPAERELALVADRHGLGEPIALRRTSSGLGVESARLGG